MRGLTAALGKPREPVSGFRCGTASAPEGTPLGAPPGHIPDTAGLGEVTAMCCMLTGRRQQVPAGPQREGRKQS